MKHALVTIALAALAATANAQEPYPPRPMTCDPLPPVGSFTRGDKLEQHDPWRFELYTRDGYFAEVRQVTGGIVVNWMGGTPSWALEPEPDALYVWESSYGAFCRHFSKGMDKTAQTDCRTDCFSWQGFGFYYVVTEARGDLWIHTASEKLAPR
jgi:hypothetical protein